MVGLGPIGNAALALGFFVDGHTLDRRPVTTRNFDEWCADPRDLTFEEYMEESTPVHCGLDTPYDATPGAVMYLPAGMEFSPAYTDSTGPC